MTHGQQQAAPSQLWAASAACAWATIFALMSLYWAAGGQLGGKTIGVEIDRLARERDASFVAELWGAFTLKALIALLALALVQPWGRRLPRRLLLVLAGATGAGITAYAVGNFVQHALMATGARSTPEGLGTYALPWHLALWDPLWLVGGLLFLAATRAFQSAGARDRGTRAFAWHRGRRPVKRRGADRFSWHETQGARAGTWKHRAHTRSRRSRLRCRSKH